MSNSAHIRVSVNNLWKVFGPNADNILEAEKILGTVHVALGDNSSFGGSVSVPFHQDFVLFEPTLILESPGEKEEVVLKDGKMVVID